MQRYFAQEKQDSKFILNENDYYHIRTVMRMNDNDRIEVVYDKKVYLCCIENVKENCQIKILNCIEETDFLEKKVTLIVPILKEQKMDLILQKSTELGVSKIIPVITERCIVKVDNEKEEKKLKRWNKILKEASEQSMRNNIPEITNITTFKELQKIDGLKLVCSTTEKNNNIRLSLQKHNNCDTINVVIGPEGGLSKKEEDYLETIGFEKISLGKRIMRVETVPLFLLSVIHYEYME